MSRKAYGAAMALVLAVVVAVAFMPGAALAQETTQQTTNTSVQKKKANEQSNVNEQNKANEQKKAETNTHMQGQIEQMMKGKMPEHMMNQMMNEKKAGATGKTTAKMSSEAKTTAPGAMKKDVSGQAKVGMSKPSGPGHAASMMSPERVAGGQGVVARVDRLDNCLRIRSGPSASDKVIGCAAKGAQLKLTGVFSRDGRWAQLNNNGWVFYSQLKTSVKPPASVASHSWRGQAGSGFRYRGRAYRPYGYGYYFGVPYYYDQPCYYVRPGHYCW